MFTVNVNNKVKLKLLDLDDRDALFRLVDNNRNYLKKWLPWVDSVQTKTVYDGIIRSWAKEYIEKESLNLGILYNEKIVGMISLHEIDFGNRKTSIGYWIEEQSQGKGIVTNCLKFLIDYAFSKLKLNRIEIRCNPENTKSIQIPIALGFEKEGVLRNSEYLNGKSQDLVVFSMIKTT
ncbi:N-acetyltransferase [Bacillus subtilis]|uniref:GNAT family N-acetyltransferase n=1 Tax=Bacillus subtilis TaxID=1423 RepID=UPI001B9B39A2|nr:GNAT family protein [Bacillus subtilis]CAF1822643.1 Putative ribosomal N-acetyltransferase YdaF [Bacillus subtilis]CAI6278139.1 N-acetyltransferase [Bacillus subtilis]